MSQNVWKKCGSCKKDILFGRPYQKCSVSSCHKLIFCSVDCWDQHVPVMNHKNAWAEEEMAPHSNQGNQEIESGRRILVTSKMTESTSSSSELDQEILIVASKFKSYIKTKHGLNTSAEVMDKLSQIVRKISDEASRHAISEGRKTIMERDFFSF